MSLLQTVVYRSSQRSMRIHTFFHTLAYQLEMLLLAGCHKDPEIVNLIKRVKRETDMAETAAAVSDRVFSFVHLDVDLYQSALECLEFFYPRLRAGDVLLGHDYQMPGARKAYTEYLTAAGARLIELANSQCLVIKM